MARNDVEDEMFSDFDYMYRHRQKKADEEQKKETQSAKAEAKPPEPLVIPEDKPEKKSEKKKKTTEKNKKNTRKKPLKPENKSEEPQKAEVHPKYGKPYKEDSDKERRRPLPNKKKKKKKKAEKKYASERTEQENLQLNEKRNKLWNDILIGLLRILKITGISLSFGLLIFAVTVGGVYALAMYHPKEEHYKVVCQIGEGETGVKISYAELVRNGAYYLRGSDMVRLCDFTVTGTQSEVKYISPDAGNESVVFYIGTSRVDVNKTEVHLNNPTLREEDELYIPLEFFTDYCNGVICNVKEETEDDNTRITVLKRILNETEYKTQGAAPVYEDISFNIKETVLLSKIDEVSITDSIDDEKYTIDISPYKDYINPKDIFEYIGVINSANPAESDYTFDDLYDVVAQTVTIKSRKLQLRLYASKALEAMIAEAKANGVTRYAVFKAYTTLEDSNLENPNTDEHLLGLSVDLYFGTKEISYGDSDVFKWFEANAHKFGFIVRYPKDKTASTGVEYRPWTLRFVGRYNATKIYNQNLSLEEYIVKYRLEPFSVE